MRQIVLILILALTSCDSRQGIKFIIRNESPDIVDSARISTSDKKSTIKLVDIKKGQVKDHYLDMTDIAKVDGHYIVEIHTKGVLKSENVGYYTNGFPQEESIDIYLTADTIIYKSKTTK